MIQTGIQISDRANRIEPSPTLAITAKVILSGKVERAFKLRGLTASAGARAAIEAAGGSIVE